MNKLALIMLLVLTGCVTTPPPPPEHTQCNQLGNYARSIETLKQIGVSSANVSAYTAQPAVVTFPMQRVRTIVYMKKFDTPADTYRYFYEMCTTVGYNNLMSALDAVEQQEMKDLSPPPPPKPPVKNHSEKRSKK